MPWRGPDYEGEFPTLGWTVGEWIEAWCVIPDGDQLGEPYKLTDEMWKFLAHHYRLRDGARADEPRSAFYYRRSQLVRPQKWGKGPLGAAWICAEAEGPVLFDGYDADGEPVGRSWATPWIQLTALSEDQTDNVYRALLPMIEQGPLADLIPDTGQTRINLAGGGLIEPVTSSGGSRLGQRITAALQDEPHSWLTTNGMRKVADTQWRNLAGTGGRAVLTTNAWDPSEQSVAQQFHESASKDLYRDYPTPPPGSFKNKRERRHVIKVVYGDSYWVDQRRIDAEAEELVVRDRAQAERFFGNRIVAGEGAWVDPALWEACTDATVVVADKEQITLGFDGSLFDDATALIGCTLEGAHLFTLGVWERPLDLPAYQEWEVPHLDVDGAVAAAFDKFKVVRFYCDPPYWQDYVDRWIADYGEAVRAWWTNRDAAAAKAVERLHTAIIGKAVTHDGDEVLTRHVGNARVEKRRAGLVLRKESKDSPRKIDAAMAAVLAYEARQDAVEDGALKKKRSRAAGF